MLLRWSSTVVGLILFIVLVYAEPDGVSDGSIHLFATLSLGGIHGRMDFIQKKEGEPVLVKSHLYMDDGSSPERVTVQVNSFPVDYTVQDKCGRETGKKLVDLTPLLSELIFGEKISQEHSVTDGLRLDGKESIWGRSLVVNADGKTGCATIQALDRPVRTLEARFLQSVGGSVYIRTLGFEHSSLSTIYGELFDVASEGRPSSSDHKWQIYTTDILGSQRDSCTFLQIMYDPEGKGESACNKDQPGTCATGDLYGKLGSIRVASKKNSFGSKRMYVDTHLMLPNTAGRRKLYLVLFHKNHDDHIFACAELKEVKPVKSQVRILSHGVNGTINFEQATPFDPTVVNIQFSNLRRQAKGFHVHQYPVPPKRTAESKVCSETAGHFNPYGVNPKESPQAGTGTHDKYEVGDLSGKYGYLTDEDQTSRTFIDSNLPMFGVNSIAGRSIVVHYTNGSRWVCGNLRYKGELLTAVAQFTYPIAGRMIFRQAADDPMSDTSIFIEYLLYNDGTKNDTDGHRWHVHVTPPGRDYYNWTQRCMSADGHFNPYQVSLTTGYDSCSGSNALRCELGDLVRKHKRLTVVSTKKRLMKTRHFFTDPNLPLSGTNSVIGRSIVIHDDHAPDHRGDRMACTSIYRKFRHKAVSENWRLNNGDKELKWDLKMTQDTEYDLTDVELKFDQLEGTKSGYHVHMLPVPREVVYACQNSEVAGHFNPFGVQDFPKNGGTPDQFEVGDLSSKWGFLDGMDEADLVYNDTNLPLFGVNSIVGRSIVVHKKKGGERWACGSLKWGYSPSEATQVSAIASFHHPDGFAWGYVRFRQVLYKSGDRSDTTVEVSLRYPGTYNKNHTKGHNWEIWVNPVSQDAVVSSYLSRCSAGGYRWNPYLIQLADPLNHDFYREECSPEVPYRCMVGDLTRRLGQIKVGGPRVVYNDRNLPLGPIDSILGRSLVIYEKDGSGNRMSCANIEPDDDIFKFVVIQQPPKFSPTSFINHVRDILGVPPWMVEIDMRYLKYLHTGDCVQFKIHFMGPIAHKLERDFSKLVDIGELAQPSLFIPGALPRKNRKTKLGYIPCSALNDDRNKYPYSGYSSSSSVLSSIMVVLLSFILTRL